MPENAREKPDRRRFLQQCLGGVLASAGVSAAGCAQHATRGVGACLVAPRAQGAVAAGDTDEQFWFDIRQSFVLDPDLAYFNAGGLGPSPKPVIDTLLRETNELESICETGHERVQAVREKLSRFLNCEPEEIAITRNATEGMNLVARGLDLRPGDEVLITTHEHPGGAMPWLALAADSGIRVNLVEPGAGGADTLSRIAAALTPRTRVVAVSHILCTTGLVLPAREIGALCRARGLICVLDGAQAVGMIPVDLHELGCDFYVCSGHKWLLGPKGSGLLYIRTGARELWHPTQVGAHSDREYDLDRGLLECRSEACVVEYGTRNAPLAVALGAAVDFLATIGMERVAQRGRALAAYLRERLATVPALEILTPPDAASSASIVTFAGKNNAFDVRNWAQPLQKQHRTRVRSVSEHGLQALRVSTHLYNTRSELDRLVVGLSELARTQEPR